MLVGATSLECWILPSLNPRIVRILEASPMSREFIREHFQAFQCKSPIL